MKNFILLIIGILMWSYSVNAAIPARPTLVSPINNAIDQSSNWTVYVWNKVSTATSYYIEIDSGIIALPPIPITGDTIRIDSANGIFTDTTTFGGGFSLANNTLYNWRVKAINADGASGWSTIWNFTTALPAPLGVYLISPIQNDATQTTSPLLIWGKNPDATKYIVEVAVYSVSNNRCGTPFIKDTVTDTMKTINNLTIGVTYCWNVYAYNGNGGAMAYFWWHFTPEYTAILSFNLPLLIMPSITSFSRTVRYNLPEQCYVSLQYYDLKGRLTASFINCMQSAGSHALSVKAVISFNNSYVRIFKAGNFVKREIVMVH